MYVCTYVCMHACMHVFIWRFLTMGVPPNHEILTGFSVTNQPFWGFCRFSIHGNPIDAKSLDSPGNCLSSNSSAGRSVRKRLQDTSKSLGHVTHVTVTAQAPNGKSTAPPLHHPKSQSTLIHGSTARNLHISSS